MDRARKAENVHSIMTWQRKEKPQGIDQEAQLKERQNDNTPGRQGKSIWKKKIVLRV